MKQTITDKNDNDNAGSSAMHIFKKSSKLDNVLYDVRGPVVEEAARMEERGTHVLKLNIGNPAPFGFRTPDEVIYDMSQQLSDCEGYSPSQGLFSARKAIMQYSHKIILHNSVYIFISLLFQYEIKFFFFLFSSIYLLF